MAEERNEPEKGDVDLDRRRALLQALVGGPVIMTLSSRPAWASEYGYKNPCDPPPKPDRHDCGK